MRVVESRPEGGGCKSLGWNRLRPVGEIMRYAGNGFGRHNRSGGGRHSSFVVGLDVGRAVGEPLQEAP